MSDGLLWSALSVIVALIGLFVVKRIYKYKKVQRNRISINAQDSIISTGNIVGGDKIEKRSEGNG